MSGPVVGQTTQLGTIMGSTTYKPPIVSSTVHAPIYNPGPSTLVDTLQPLARQSV